MQNSGDELDVSSKIAIQDYWQKTLQVKIPLETTGPILKATSEQKFLTLFKQGESLAVSGPQHAIDQLNSCESKTKISQLFSKSSLDDIFSNVPHTVLGPAYLGYSDAHGTPVENTGRFLLAEDNSLMNALREAVGEVDWEAGGVDMESPCVLGVCERGKLLAVGSFDIWGDKIAHHCVLTHPRVRGKGYGTKIVSWLQHEAKKRDLVSQYRTLLKNEASINVARKLFFLEFATTMAVQFQTRD